MKFIIILFLAPTLLLGQYDFKSKIGPAGVLVFSGAWDGIGEQLKWHWKDFYNTYPKAKEQFWNPNKSWVNKWEFDIFGNIRGEKFPGSSTVFVFTTDGYHLSRSISKLSGALGGAWLIHKKQKWYYYIFDFLIYSAARGLGFHLTYSVLPKL